MKGATEADLLFDRLGDIGRALRGARLIFLFLDFDGTLAPIVEDPDAASISPESRRHLAGLARREMFRVALISGRSLSDLQQRVGIGGITYAGNHGLEIRGPGFSFAEPAALERVSVLRGLARTLEIRLGGTAGVRVEDKRLTASVHYRNARPEDKAAVRLVVEETVASASSLFQVIDGLEVSEIRPRVNWNKGTAARWILASTGRLDALPVYVGDDATDEDAFSVLADGITVRVGRTPETLAHYQLECQQEVEPFLAWLGETDDRRSESEP
jgi:trehalose 6-phosphate phosphatase